MTPPEPLELEWVLSEGSAESSDFVRRAEILRNFDYDSTVLSTFGILKLLLWFSVPSFEY